MMKKKILLITICILAISVLTAQDNYKLWYTKPAEVWVEALPVGNGRLGAMVFGRVEEEFIQLNESTLWSGGPVAKSVNPEAASHLPAIREALLKEEDYRKAEALTKKMQGLYSQSYLPLADLIIRQQFNGSLPSAYRRELDIVEAITTTTFTVNGVHFKREIFASHPEQVIIIRITSSQPGQINLTLSAKSQLRPMISASPTKELVMKGRAPVQVDPSYYNVNKEPVVYNESDSCKGMRYELRVKASSKDGVINLSDTTIDVINATELIFFVSAATSFNGFDKCPVSQGKDESKMARAYLDKASGKAYSTIRQNHVTDYQKYFKRVDFQLKDTGSVTATMPSDERLKAFSRGAYDPSMETLFFQFGRYLLISCSRPGGIAANLQGLWNHHLRAPWSSNYTININTEMNYWPAEMTNLSEMHEPLITLIKNLAVTGKATANEFYRARGWVAHHNTDIWALSNPVGDLGKGDPKWANWQMGGNWLTQHLWEHYRFTNDKTFLLHTAYPLMKSAALFCLDWLVEDKDGYLVTAPSTSPENSFRYDSNKTAGVAIGSTMDISIIWDVFTNVIDASKVLNTDAAFRELLTEKRSKLYPLKIGRQGNLQEWHKDFEEVEVQHRHVSHLFGLHPGRQISPITTPELAKAARRTLEIRGDVGTGWSKAWKINFWARLLDGDHTYLLIRELMQYKNEVGTNYTNSGGIYPNFFDAHPPFQIDGNFGAVSGMAEMLLQSHLDELHLLPALPSAWKEGKIAGLKGRGNYDVSLQWSGGKLRSADIRANSSGHCKLRTSVPVNLAGTVLKTTRSGNDYISTFSAVKGKTYRLTAAGN
jgi:alpha-L-fucosidase 2